MFQLAPPRCCTDVRRVGAPPSTTVASDRNWIYEMGSGVQALLREGRRGLLPDSRRLPANSLHHAPRSCSRKGPDAFRPKALMPMLTRKASTSSLQNGGTCIFRCGQEQQFELLSNDGMIPTDSGEGDVSSTTPLSKRRQLESLRQNKEDLKRSTRLSGYVPGASWLFELTPPRL
jgi:hypothetical protein